MKTRNDIIRSDNECLSPESCACGLGLQEVRCEPYSEEITVCSCGGVGEGRSSSGRGRGVECIGPEEQVSFGVSILECASGDCDSDCCCQC